MQTKWIHRLSDIDLISKLATCKNCGVVKIGVYGKRIVCSISKRKYYRTDCGKYKYRREKKDSCELCDFVPINKCQLDVDHIDGNHKNDTVENLQTLCANCHRLKTFLQRKNAS